MGIEEALATLQSHGAVRVTVEFVLVAAPPSPSLVVTTPAPAPSPRATTLEPPPEDDPLWGAVGARPVKRPSPADDLSPEGDDDDG